MALVNRLAVGQVWLTAEALDRFVVPIFTRYVGHEHCSFAARRPD